MPPQAAHGEAEPGVVIGMVRGVVGDAGVQASRAELAPVVERWFAQAAVHGPAEPVPAVGDG